MTVGKIENPIVTAYEALESFGLDVVRFDRWTLNGRRNMSGWPSRVLYEYFYQLEDSLGDYCGPYGESFFLKMGVRQGAAEKIVKLFRKSFSLSLSGRRPLEFFASVFSSVAKKAYFDNLLAAGTISFSESLIAAVDLKPKPSENHEHNRKALLDALKSDADLVLLKKNNLLSPALEIRIIKEPKESEQTLYYYGTSIDDAAIIFATCPSIFMAQPRSDFSGGFYLTSDLTMAKKFANSKAFENRLACQQDPPIGCVIVYKLDSDFSQHVLKLGGNPDEWQRNVQAFRYVGHLDLDYKHQVVSGPISVHSSSSRRSKQLESISDQLAITSPELARSLNNCIHGIFFVNGGTDQEE